LGGGWCVGIGWGVFVVYVAIGWLDEVRIGENLTGLNLAVLTVRLSRKKRLSFVVVMANYN
jgi:hypothetical protein